jgi:hypothetical protein
MAGGDRTGTVYLEIFLIIKPNNTCLSPLREREEGTIREQKSIYS